MRRHLVHATVLGRPDRAEPLALRPDGIGPPVEAALDLVGPRVRRRVEVEVGPIVAEDQVAHGPTDEEQPVPRGAEPLRERPQLLEDGLEALRDHEPASGCVRHRSAIRSSSRTPGPPELGASVVE
jgi:hypothetical protein